MFMKIVTADSYEIETSFSTFLVAKISLDLSILWHSSLDQCIRRVFYYCTIDLSNHKGTAVLHANGSEVNPDET